MGSKTIWLRGGVKGFAIEAPSPHRDPSIYYKKDINIYKKFAKGFGKSKIYSYLYVIKNIN